jgi:hypothetical protein
MNTLYVNSTMNDDDRRRHLYAGQLFVYRSGVAADALVLFTRNMVEEVLGPTPWQAQDSMPVDEYARILAELKPRFIHHPETKGLLRALLSELGCDPDKTYFDVPRLRTSTHSDYLTTGIAYAFHPHRDTWYSAPESQINWWLPVYDIQSENAMAFHCNYWDRPLRNSSSVYNYAEWNRTSRMTAAQHVKSDTREQPKPTESVELDPQLRVVAEPGGVLLFSGAHLHSSVPNTSRRTRFSIDFRTVHLDDALQEQGAPNIDSACSGTTMGDYLRLRDLEHFPDDLIARYDRRKTPRA